jgi:hypothetical protein
MKNENISKLKALLMGVCLLLVVALIIFLFVVERNNKPTTNNNEDKNVKYEKHTSYDGLFSIEAPNTWKEVETKNSLNENAILELEKEDDNAYLVVVINNKKDLNETFAQFKTNVFKQKESVYKKNISKYVDVVIAERPAQYGVIYYTKDNVNTYIRAYAFETENYYGQIVIWTLASNEEKVQDEFDKIVSSIKEI